MAAPHLNLAPVPTEVGAIASERSSIRVVLADGHTLMRRSLRLLLDGETDVEVIAEAGDLASVLSQMQSLRADVLGLDLSLPGGSSTEAIAQLRERVPDTEIVALTMEDDPVFAQRALAAGALGFVTKDLADSQLLPAVRAAARGEEYVSPRVAARLEALQALRRGLLGT